jgi:hypothetical protein
MDRAVVRRPLLLHIEAFESVEDIVDLDMEPAKTFLRTRSGGCWDIEEGNAERIARAIAYLNVEALPMGTSKSPITVEEVDRLIKKDAEARQALVGVPRETTLQEVEEAVSMAWSDAVNLEGSETMKLPLCNRLKHAMEYIDELKERRTT